MEAGQKAQAERRRSGHLALLVVQWIFGLLPIFGVLAMEPGRGLHPFSLTAWRIAGGALVLGGLALFTGSRLRPDRGDLPRLLACSALGMVANQGLYLSGLQRSNAHNAGLMMCLVPVFTFLVAALVGQERFSPRRVAGLLLSLVGVLPLVVGPGVDLLGEYGTGNLMIVLNTLCYAVYLVISKPLRRKYSVVSLLALNYIMALPFLPLFLGAGPLLPVDSGDGTVWRSIAFVVLGPSILAYMLNMFALGRVRASTVAVYVYLQPLISTLGGVLILGEELYAPVFLAAVALFTGIYLVGGERERKRQGS